MKKFQSLEVVLQIERNKKRRLRIILKGLVIGAIGGEQPGLVADVDNRLGGLPKRELREGTNLLFIVHSP